jgi:hypothetical protein
MNVQELFHSKNTFQLYLHEIVSGSLKPTNKEKSDINKYKIDLYKAQIQPNLVISTPMDHNHFLYNRDAVIWNQIILQIKFIAMISL